MVACCHPDQRISRLNSCFVKAILPNMLILLLLVSLVDWVDSSPFLNSYNINKKSEHTDTLSLGHYFDTVCGVNQLRCGDSSQHKSRDDKTCIGNEVGLEFVYNYNKTNDAVERPSPSEYFQKKFMQTAKELTLRTEKMMCKLEAKQDDVMLNESKIPILEFGNDAELIIQEACTTLDNLYNVILKESIMKKVDRFYFEGDYL